MELPFLLHCDLLIGGRLRGWSHRGLLYGVSGLRWRGWRILWHQRPEEALPTDCDLLIGGRLRGWSHRGAPIWRKWSEVTGGGGSSGTNALRRRSLLIARWYSKSIAHSVFNPGSLSCIKPLIHYSKGWTYSVIWDASALDLMKT